MNLWGGAISRATDVWGAPLKSVEFIAGTSVAYHFIH